MRVFLTSPDQRRAPAGSNPQRNASGWPARQRWLGLLLFAAAMAFGDDGAITDRVRQRLFSDPDVKGHAVDVESKDGVVTLSGSVETGKGRTKAEKLAKKVSGVKKVVNNLRVEVLRPRR